MNVLVLGSGGREHALAWKIKQSQHCNSLFVAPGNAGTSGIAENIDISVSDFPAISDFIVSHQIDLLVVGPEDPLVKGIRDFLTSDARHSELKIIGPGKAGAMLEGSKEFSKSFMLKHGIPTGQAITFSKENIQDGVDYLKSKPSPIVLKADGLAAGKGVIIAQSHEEAETSLKEMLLDKKFGEASERVLIEDFLSGIELSVFVLTDGKDYVILPEAKDYKRIGEHDTGPNTGGMGAVSPVLFADQTFMRKVEEKVVVPTIQGLKDDGIPYIGFIFIGLMNMNGEPYVIEYNVRMGDPETQAVLSRIDGDLLELLSDTATGQLDKSQIRFKQEVATTVVLASEGYPGSYEKGKPITGIESSDMALVFHAGTKSGGGQTLTNGGRVLAVTGLGNSIESALENAYSTIENINWDGKIYRRDIGQDLINYTS